MAFPKSDSTTLPKYTLSQFRLPHFQQAEDYFAQRFLNTVAKAASGQVVAVAREQLATANETVARGRFVYGSPNFDSECNRQTSLPFLLWLSLSIKHAVTQEEAESLITDENESAVKAAVLAMMKFAVPVKNVAAPAPQKPATDTTPANGGENSTAPSAPEGSPPSLSND